MSDDTFSRVHYFEKQYLRAQDFNDEQAYHLAMHRRHNIAHHTWGIVEGLRLYVDENRLLLSPGVAIDGYGRELVLPQQQPLSINIFEERASDYIDIYLRYTRAKGDAVQSDGELCEVEGEERFYRWLEDPEIRYVIPDPFNERPQYRFIPGLPFPPSETPPDDPIQDWMVYIGRINRNAADESYTVDMSKRLYVGLRGEFIFAPSNGAIVQIGAEVEEDLRRFAVFVPKSDGAGGVVYRPTLEINQDDNITINDETIIHGDVTIRDGTLDFDAATDQEPATSPLQRAWRMYRRQDVQTGSEELRIEIPQGVATAPTNRVVIGSWSPDEERFKPCLEVNDDNQVIVHGTLIAQHLNVQTGADNVKAQSFSPEADRNILSSFIAGVGGGSLLLPDLFVRSAQPTAPVQAFAAQGAGSNVSNVASDVADAIDDDPQQAEALAQLLAQSDPSAATQLLIALFEQILGSQ
ncbi:MAG: hypothetical protein CL607_21125 [Anaerolineaceae bacterium]|nr:hypothetical protein [Anaerolineaceae bacterium]